MPVTYNDAIENKAKKLIKEARINSLPINPLLIAEIEDINVYKTSFNSADVSGIIRKNKDGVKIYIKENEYKPRQRFTVAHELGHYYLHLKDEIGNFVDGDKMLNRDESNTQSQEELEANQFAAALLMPKENVIDLVRKGYSEMAIAEILDVSLPALKIRLKTLKDAGFLNE